MRHSTKVMKFFRERPLLLAILAIGFLLRVSGILWVSLPTLSTALIMPTNGPLSWVRLLFPAIF